MKRWNRSKVDAWLDCFCPADIQPNWKEADIAQLASDCEAIANEEGVTLGAHVLPLLLDSLRELRGERRAESGV